VLVIIDGHNLIGQMPDIQLDEAHDEDRLLTRLRQYRARTGRTLLVFFDGGSTYKPGQSRTKGGITVRYAPHGVTADQLIINRLQKLTNPQQTLVVSSDRVIQRAAKFARARIMPSAEFAAQLSARRPAKRSRPDADAEADVRLSDAEVNEWLDLFNRHKGD